MPITPYNAKRGLADPAGGVWVAGCATGEEAYSIAILLKEGLAQSESRRPVQIFATDVDDHAIQAARAGLYLASTAADLSAERLEGNFIQEDSSYRVTKDIRELCLFSTHDLLPDGRLASGGEDWQDQALARRGCGRAGDPLPQEPDRSSSCIRKPLRNPLGATTPAAALGPRGGGGARSRATGCKHQRRQRSRSRPAGRG